MEDLSTKNFKPIPIKGNSTFDQLLCAGVSEEMCKRAKNAPRGKVVAWGLPFHIKKIAVVKDDPITVKFASIKAPWLVFMQTSDIRPLKKNKYGFISPMRGSGQLGEHTANYCVLYTDGTEVEIPIRQRFQIAAFGVEFGERCCEAVADLKPQAVSAEGDDKVPLKQWMTAQTRGVSNEGRPWLNWLWVWENRFPGKEVVGLRIEPVNGVVIVSAISAGKASSNPLRWLSRRKAVLTIPKGQEFDPHLDSMGQSKHIRLDMGQVISVTSRPLYPNEKWSKTYNNQQAKISDREILIEYTAHPDARFYLPNGKTVSVAKLERGKQSAPVCPVAPALQLITIRAVDKNSGGQPVAVKLHVHGEAGEYLPPNVNHRIPNEHGFQDYSVDFSHAWTKPDFSERGIHYCTYIPGEAQVRLPLGKVYIEISKGFEIHPIRKVVCITPSTKEVVVKIDKILNWRERGWVSADTHVHFLSPPTGLLEGAGEGVNVVNLLASQWGELMTNVGDFDGKTTYGSKEAGGEGEYLVRVGTENRQHMLGHISLLGYEGKIIAPMASGGLDESALGDPLEVLLTEWAQQCKRQNGVVILPHFPMPRCEGAASIVSGNVDAVEMTSWCLLYEGISPYSLSDWYRYLNCGYFVPVVGGTDKMCAITAVGTVRTYAKIDDDREFNYETWKEALRYGNTFVTYGPLLEFAVEGSFPGTRVSMSHSGGTVDVTWKVASVTVPMSRVDLVINGEIRESRSVHRWKDEGSWSVKLEKSSWIALLVRGHYHGKPEIIAAHSSPVMVDVEGTVFMAAADALTILEQIEGALAHFDTVGTRAETKAYKRMRLVLTSAHRELHNRMHQDGCYHKHTCVEDHPEHNLIKQRD